MGKRQKYVPSFVVIPSIGSLFRDLDSLSEKKLRYSQKISEICEMRKYGVIKITNTRTNHDIIWDEGYYSINADQENWSDLYEATQSKVLQTPLENIVVSEIEFVCDQEFVIEGIIASFQKQIELTEQEQRRLIKLIYERLYLDSNGKGNTDKNNQG